MVGRTFKCYPGPPIFFGVALCVLLSVNPTFAGAFDTVAVYYDNLTASYSTVNIAGSAAGSYGGVAGNGWVAWANFSNQMEENGWSFLKVVTNERYPDGIQAYAAGLAEGHLTTNLLSNHWMNTVDINCRDSDEQSSRTSTPSYCTRLSQFLNENLQWMREQIIKNVAEEPYWHQVDLTLKQIQGLQDGCQSSFLKTLDEPVIQEFGFLMFNMFGDLLTFDTIWNRTRTGTDGVPPGSCSAIVKMLPNNEDLYAAHATWYSYRFMTRILKKYEFNYHLTNKEGSPLIPGRKMTFSSYPGVVLSVDDYNLMSSGLLTMETSLDVFNVDLWPKIQPRALLSFARTVAANRLATDGESWTNIFADHNAGTYNNQWMIVDYNKFAPGEKELQNGLLWVLEQLPGSATARDQTDVLRHESYWASYNLPFYPEVFTLSGTEAKYETLGDYYSHSNSSRAQMFRQFHTNVTDTTSLLHLMRYNDFENDPMSESNCSITQNAMEAIAARGDLVPEGTTCPIEALTHDLLGAYDTKAVLPAWSSVPCTLATLPTERQWPRVTNTISSLAAKMSKWFSDITPNVTNSKMFSKLEFVAWGGPTYDQQPPFQWSKVTESDSSKNPHKGQPDLWKFLSIRAKWD